MKMNMLYIQVIIITLFKSHTFESLPAAAGVRTWQR